MSSDDVRPVHSEDEILERVYARGRQVRMRKRVARALTSVVVISALFAMGAGVARTVHTPNKTPAAFKDETPSPTPTYSVEPSPSDSVSIPPLGPGPVPDESASPSPSGLVCVNSFDPACGNFYWTPDPGPDAPLVVTIGVSTTTAMVGETVTLTMHAVDPDASIECAWAFFGEHDIAALNPPTIPNRYGAWSTPPKQPGNKTETFTHRYTDPGTYNVFVVVESGSCSVPKYGPYDDNESSDKVAVTVVGPSPTATPAPSPSDSPTPSPTAT